MLTNPSPMNVNVTSLGKKLPLSATTCLPIVPARPMRCNQLHSMAPAAAMPNQPSIKQPPP